MKSSLSIAAISVVLLTGCATKPFPVVGFLCERNTLEVCVGVFPADEVLKDKATPAAK